MPRLEAGIAVIRGRVKENVSIPFPVDAYYDVVLIPGFSDTHAHPQVIDAGLIPGKMWSSSYEWLLTREMVINEASVRGDIGLSARLAELAMKRALLEGTTLIALTGRFEANVKAFTRMKTPPRTVLLPTVMKRKGWATPRELEKLFSKYAKYTKDDLLRVGIFVHSISYGGPVMLRESQELALRVRGPLGIHLSEGVSEKKDFAEYSCCLDNLWVVAVHCLDDDYGDLGVRCSSCPGSNITLYRRYLKDLSRATSFGSDWPHLLGTVGGQIGLISTLYSNRLEEALFKATIGGYNDYLVGYSGDLAAYDGSLSQVLSGMIRPKLVTVNYRPAVMDGLLIDTGERYSDIIRATQEAIDYAVEVHGLMRRPVMPDISEILRYARSTTRLARSARQ